MKPLLKAPGSMLLKLRYDGLLLTSAFNFNFRRYIVGEFNAGKSSVINAVLVGPGRRISNSRPPRSRRPVFLS